MNINAKRVGLISSYEIKDDCFIKKGKTYKFVDIQKIKYDFPKASTKMNGSFTICINNKSVMFGIHKSQYDEISIMVDKLINDLKNKDIKNNDKMEKKYELFDFDEVFKNVPKYEIKANGSANRNVLMMLDNIKINTITKNFNKDSMIKYVTVSINTTGLKATNDDILELCAIKYIDYEPIEIFHTYINPRKELIEEDYNNQKYDKMLIMNSPKIKNIMNEFDDFVKGYNIVSFNTSFVLKFLYVNGSNILEQKNVKLYDTMELSKKCFGEYNQDYSLKNMFFMFEKKLIEDDTLSKCGAINTIFNKCIDLLINE